MDKNQVTTYRASTNDWDESARVAAIDLELIFQERAQVLLFRECLPHRLGKGSPRRLSQPTHVHNLILALEHSHLIEQWLQRLDLAVIDKLLQLLRSNRGSI